MCVGIVAIYAIFGLLQLECGNELTCGVVVLSFQARYIYTYTYIIYIYMSIPDLLSHLNLPPRSHRP